MPAGSNGLMVVLDWLAPTEVPFRKGAMLGFDVRHDRFHIHRAILGGHRPHHLPLRPGDGQRAGRDLRPHGRLRRRLELATCSCRSSPTSSGSQASRCKVHDAAGLGSAICAAVGAGLYASFDEAIEHMVSSEPPFAPEAGNHGLYRQMSAVYDQITSKTDTIFEQSYKIFG